MANQIKGQKSVTLDGATYTLEFTPNGFCELEDATGKGTMEFLRDLQLAAEAETIHFRDVRLLFWAGLQEHHPDMDIKAAGGLMRKMGGLQGAMSELQEAIALAMPDGEGAEDEATANPPKAATA